MNITILDGYTLNPGDLSWQQFEELWNGPKVLMLSLPIK